MCGYGRGGLTLCARRRMLVVRSIVGLRHTLMVTAAVTVLAASCTSSNVDDAALLSTSTTGSASTTSAAISSTTPSTTFALGIPNAETYLLDAIEIVETQALLADSIDWEERRSLAGQTAATAQTDRDLYVFIREMLNDLGDHHWDFSTPLDVSRRPDELPDSALPTYELVESRIGALQIGPYLVYGDDDEAVRYAQATHDGLAALDDAGVCGWIIDLRGNVGGFIVPMFATVASFVLPNAESRQESVLLGYFTNRAGTELRATYNDGIVKFGDEEVLTVPQPHVLDDPQAPVALLLSSNTQSAGEVTALLLEGRGSTKRFGFPTSGTPALAEGVVLSDGAVMQFTNSTFTDPTGHVHEPVGSLEPDVTGGGTRPAIEWLLTQPACRSGD
jgi:carboxyl-terminal processing protease